MAPGARLVEIGPGTGALTKYLYHRFPDLEVIEIDRRAVELLRTEFPGLKIHQQDVLQTNWHDIADAALSPISVIGNLPYYITSPILFSVLDNRQLFDQAIFMMQKEVAMRLVARPGSGDYGILSVQTQLLSEPEYLFTVSRHVFNPPPKVESAMVKLTFKKPPPSTDLTQLKTVIRTSFNQRRKMLSNALKPILSQQIPDPDARHEFSLKFGLNRRAEALEPHEFVGLTNALFGR